MTWPVSFDTVDAEEAIAWFADRLILTRAQIRDLRAAAARRAFYVSGVAQLDVVTEVWNAIDDALKKGTDLETFKAAVGEKLERAWNGTVDDPAHRLEVIFRTNVQSAYAAGRFKQATDPDIASTRPYWMFDAILDKHTTQVCEDCDGTIRPNDDPWWQSHLPPLHFKCRSHFLTLTADQARKRGITGKPTSAQAAPGFGKAPGVDEWEASRNDYPAPLWKEFEKKEPEPAIDQSGLRPLSEWAKDAKAALGNIRKDGGAAARALLREHVTSLGLVSIDERDEREDRNKLVSERDAGVAELRSLGMNRAYHDWAGKIVISNDVSKEARSALAHLVEHPDKAVPPEDLKGIATLFHEEIHGCSPLLPQSNSGIGTYLEEAGTEILARRAIRDLLRDDSVFPLPEFGKLGFGGDRYKTSDDPVRIAYNPYIKGLMHAVIEATGRTNVGPLLEAAFVEIRAAKGASFEEPIDQMEALIESRALGLDAEEKKKLRKRLTKGDNLMTRYPYVEGD